MRALLVLGLVLAGGVQEARAASTRVAIVGVRGGSADGAAELRLVRGLRESELDVAPSIVVERAVGPDGTRALAACVLARDQRCATAPVLRGVFALALAELSPDGKTGHLVAVSPDGVRLFESTFHAHSIVSLLTQLEEEARLASRAIADADHNAPLIASRGGFGWGALGVGAAFGTAAGILGGRALQARNTLGARWGYGPTSPVEAYGLQQQAERDSLFAIGLGSAAFLAAASGLYMVIATPGGMLESVQVAPAPNGLVVGGTFR